MSEPETRITDPPARLPMEPGTVTEAGVNAEINRRLTGLQDSLTSERRAQ